MCGRFNVIDNPELQQLLRELTLLEVVAPGLLLTGAGPPA